VIYEIECDKPYKLPDHHNQFGEAWWNDGHTEEEVNVPIYENCGTEDEQIQDYFETWLDNNEDVGYERLP
jgi:hypothetical protein